MAFEIIHGYCLEVMRGMADNSVDAVVTDPPYGLSFMGKKWDYDVPSVEVWAECLRVLKPGGHLLAFAGTRTQHRMAVRIEDAGFEIRDMIAWVYGSGFPKSHNVAIGIDKMNGAPPRGRAIVVAGRGEREDLQGKDANPRPHELDPYAPATEAARQWQGWGTALKPALEPITMARKPLVGTVAENVLAHGTGAINVDACRVPLEEDCRLLKGGTYGGNRGSDKGTSMFGTNTKGLGYEVPSANGRWPANLIHDGSEEVLAGFPKSSTTGKRSDKSKSAEVGGTIWLANNHQSTEYTDAGFAARFFYCAKASKSDRGESNGHPTVKPTELMRYLCRLVTPPSGTVLDPFTGSGSTGKAAVLEGFEFIGIEREAEYVAIAEARIAEAQKSLGLFA